MDAKEKLQRERTAASLERWYAARGSRTFTGVWQFRAPPPVVVDCSVDGCRQPAKITEFGVDAFCADHFPAVVRS